MKATVTSAFNRTTTNVKSAFTRSLKRAGIETNPSVMLYNTLREEDFSKLSEIYGQEFVMNYVRDMESKRLFK